MSISNPMRGTIRAAAKPATLHGRSKTTKRAGAKASFIDLATLIASGRVPAEVLSRQVAALQGRVSPTRAVRLKKALAEQQRRLKASSAASLVLVEEVVRLEPEVGQGTLQVFLSDMLEFDQLSDQRLKLREIRAIAPRTPAAMRPADNTAVLARVRQAGEAFKAKVLAQPDMLSAEDAAGKVGKSRQTINDQRLAGKIIGLSFGSDRFRYPEWQFHDNVYGKPLEAALEALGDADAWEKWRFFTTEDGMLAGKAPAAVMQSGEFPLDRVIRAAKAFSER